MAINWDRIKQNASEYDNTVRQRNKAINQAAYSKTKTTKKEDEEEEMRSFSSFLSSLPAYKRAYSSYTAPKTGAQTFSFPSSSKTPATTQNIGTGALKAELADRRASGNFTMPGSHEGRVKELEAHGDTVRNQLRAQFQPLDYRGEQIEDQDTTAADLLNSSLAALAQEAAQESFLADIDRLSTRTTGRPGNISVEDFLSKSRYVPTGSGEDAKFNAVTGMYSSTGFDDILYDYINRNPKAVEIQELQDVQLGHGALGLDQGYLSQMGDREVGIFNYLYATQGPDAAYSYIDEIKNSLTARNRAEEEAMWRSMARESPADTAGMSVFSVLTSPAKGLSYIGQLADYAADGTIDQNAGTNRLSYINSAIRSEASDIVETNWGAPGSFFYNTGMSMADFLYATAISGGFGAAPGTAAAKASSGLALSIMGTGAAADTVIASKDRGLSDDQSFALGTIAGLAEIATEKFSLDALLKDPKNAVLFVLQNAGVEASEETASSLINFIADIAISKNKSEWQMSINDYISQGYSENEAFGKAFADQAKSIGLDALGGALSGGVLSGARVGANAIYNRASGAHAVDAGSPIIQNQYATDTEAQQQTQTDPLQALAEEMAAKEAEEIFPTVEERPRPKPQKASVVSEQQQQETAPEPSWKKYTGAPRADGTNPAAQARTAARQAAESADLASMSTDERESFLQAYDMGRSGESFEADVSSLPVQSDAVYGAFFQGQDDYFNGSADRYQAYRTRETSAEQATQVETSVQEAQQISQAETPVVDTQNETQPLDILGGENTAPVRMSLDEYLGLRGLRAPISDYMDDKLRLPHGETQRQRARREAEANAAADDYAARRKAAIQEYERKVQSGEIVEKTRIERLIDTARGRDENESVQSARRVLEKRGIDWRVDDSVNALTSPVSDQSSPGTSSKKEGVQIPIEERTWQDAGNRKVNAFQYDNPELHPYFVEAAKALQYDLAASVKGERLPVYDASSETGKDIIGFTGTKRSVTEPIAQALDNANLSYAQIEKALDDLIADNGQENYAAAKKVELVLDDMLTDGYTDSDGNEVPPNEDYIALKKRTSSADGSTYRMSEEEWSSIMATERKKPESEDVDRMASTSARKEGEYKEEWESSRVGDTSKSSMPLSDIISKIEHDFGINVTVGHILGSGTRGQYNRKERGIRTKIANQLPVVAHELGHHFDNVYGFTKSISPELQSELVDNLGADMKKAYPERKWVKEGMAEFMRRFLQNRETAAIDYPEFTKYFLSSLNNTDGPHIEQLADEVNAYYSMDTDSASSSVRFAEEGGRDFRTVPEKIKDMGASVYQAWIDSNYGIKRFSDKADTARPYIMATNAAYSDAMAAQIIAGDLTDKDGRYVSSGLSTALQGINLKNKTEYRAFGEYLIVKHGPERLKEGLRVFADDRKNSTQWMEKRRAELEEKYPAFKKASEQLYNFEKQFLQTWGVSTGLVSKKSASDWGKRWSFYVPFNRAIEKGGGGAKRSFANQSSGIKKAVGSGLDIVHPVDNIIYNIVRMVNASVRNNVMVEITDAADAIGGMANFLEKVPTPMKRISFSTSELKKTLGEDIEKSQMSQTDKDAAFDIVNDIDEILYQYTRGKAGGDVVTVMKEGDPEYWKINDEGLLESISKLAPSKMPAFLEVYGSISRFMTSNITGNNVLWSIFSNSPRDLMTFFTYSKNKNPFKLLGGIASSYLNKVRGQNADPLYKEYLAMGGGSASAYSADRSLAKSARKNFSRSIISYLNPIDLISFVSDTIEMGPRFSYYKVLRGEGVDSQTAFYEAMDVTTNFRRGGTVSRELNKVVPFFNASVQGIDKFSRWITAQDAPAKNRKKAAATRASMYVASSLALAAIFYALNNRSDDDKKNYQQLSNYTKNAYWCIPIGDGKFFAVPKPRELAVLSSFFETSMEYFHGDNNHAFDEFYDYAIENFLPSGFSDLAKADVFGAVGSIGLFGVGAYMMANRDFMGRPIVSSGLQSLEPKDQYTERTSKIAKVLGDAFNQSPQMIDYFFQQTLGGWWKAQKALFPVGDAEIDPTLGIRNTYIKDSQYSTDLVNWLYDTSESSTAAKNSAPDDTEKAITAKWDSNMQEFYSRYYAVSKNSPETDLNRSIRQEVLDMIADYRNLRESGDKTSAQKTAESIAKKANDTGLLPSVMQNSVKDANDKVHTLSGPQYVEFQTDYLRIYWEAVEGAVSKVDSQKEKELVLEKAKSVALDEAKIRALKRIGAPYQEEKEEDEGGNEDESIYSVGLTPSEAVLYEIAYGMAESELDENGKTIPGSKQEKVIEAIDDMSWLSPEQKSWLFRSKYTSDKNNPWA